MQRGMHNHAPFDTHPLMQGKEFSFGASTGVKFRLSL